MRITIDGTLQEGVTSKDIILHIIGVVGASEGTGYVIEYAGPVISGFSMESRMSICNMSIEAGARAGMVAPDNTTFDYLRNRPFAPKGEAWDQAVQYWKTLTTDENAAFDVEIKIHAEDIVPTVTWGTSPQDTIPITGRVPHPASFEDPVRRASAERALKYMGLVPGMLMEDIKLDRVFIGSCTNSRIEDLRSAAKIILAAGSDAKVANGIVALVVPGSGLVKQHAEAEGLDKVFERAGFQWREAGCSMCMGLNSDRANAEERCASTSNRNFEGRQGPGSRTHLVSPAMAAAAALMGKLTDVRTFAKSDISPPIAISSGLDHVFAASQHFPPTHWHTDITSQDAVVLPTARQPENIEISTTITSPRTKVTVLKGIAAPIHRDNIDTDVIIPVRFCKAFKGKGQSVGLFDPLRRDPRTGQSTGFVLDRPPYTNAKIIVCTGVNFGCGSSREQAVWSL